MKMGLADASNKDKMDKTIYQSDYFTGYGVKDWGALSSEVLVPNQIVRSWAKLRTDRHGPADLYAGNSKLASYLKLRIFGDMICLTLF